MNRVTKGNETSTNSTPASKAKSKGNRDLNKILIDLYKNNEKEYIAINRILNISINLVKSDKVIYRTLFTIILNTFEEAVKKIVNGNRNSLKNSNIANHECTGALNTVPDMSNAKKSWDASCYKKLLVNPSAVINLLKDSMLFQLATINVDFDKIIVNKNRMYSDDMQLSNATREIMNSMKRDQESNVAMQRMYDIVTRKDTRSEIPDRNSLFEILRIFNEINDNYDESRKLYKKIRSLKKKNTVGSGNTLSISSDNEKHIAKNIQTWLKVYKEVYGKLLQLINKGSSGDNVAPESLLTLSDESTISIDKLDKLQKKLRYIIGERIEKLNSNDKNPDTLVKLITGQNSVTNSSNSKGGSKVSGKMIKQLFILFYVFYLSITAQSLEVYTRGLKQLDIQIQFSSDDASTATPVTNT